jgi:hypothetical protein
MGCTPCNRSSYQQDQTCQADKGIDPLSCCQKDNNGPENRIAAVTMVLHCPECNKIQVDIQYTHFETSGCQNQCTFRLGKRSQLDERFQLDKSNQGGMCLRVLSVQQPYTTTPQDRANIRVVTGLPEAHTQHKATTTRHCYEHTCDGNDVPLSCCTCQADTTMETWMRKGSTSPRDTPRIGLRSLGQLCSSTCLARRGTDQNPQCQLDSSTPQGILQGARNPWDNSSPIRTPHNHHFRVAPQHQCVRTSGQSWQKLTAGKPVALLKLPAGHKYCVGDAVPVGQYDPAGQSMSVSLVAPVRQ